MQNSICSNSKQTKNHYADDLLIVRYEINVIGTLVYKTMFVLHI